MGFLSRLKTGWGLAMDGLGVLRDDPELAVFPLVAGVAGLAYLALLFGVVSVVGTSDGLELYAVLFALYVGTTFVASFFTAGLVHETREAFEGREPTFRGGIAAAWANVGTILVWALVSATVGVVIRAIENQSGVVGDLLAGLFSVAWSILTYFVVPVIVFEDVGVTAAISRSGETFKDTWGETAGAGFGVGLITVVFVGAAIVVSAALFYGASSVGSAIGTEGALVVGVVLVVLAYLASVTLGAIARTALYVYATEGLAPDQFGNVDFARVR